MSEASKVEITDAHRAIYCVAQVFAALGESDLHAAAEWAYKAEQYKIRATNLQPTTQNEDPAK